MDQRDLEYINEKFYKSFNESNMTFVVEYYNDDDEEVKVELPARFEVCELCNGRGTHVHPSVDACGISKNDFDDDPEFEEAYFGGHYDVACYRCKGKRVEPIVNEDILTTRQKESWDNIQKQWAEVMQDRLSDYFTRRMESGYG